MMEIDKAIQRQIGVWLLLVIGAFGTVILELIKKSNWSDTWLYFIGIVWYSTETLAGVIIYYCFKVSKADLLSESKDTGPVTNAIIHVHDDNGKVSSYYVDENGTEYHTENIENTEIPKLTPIEEESESNEPIE